MPQIPSARPPLVPWHLRTVVAMLVVALLLGSCSGDADDDAGASGATTCPTEVDAEDFATAEEMRDLLAEFTAFGLRSPGSTQHEASLEWLADELAAVPDMEVAWDEYEMERWEPTPEAPGDTPGRDLAAAGGLTVATAGGDERIDVIGAVPFSLPTTGEGVRAPLVVLAPGEAMTAENSAGKIVVQHVEHATIPMSAFDIIGHHVTDDIDTTAGDYDRPYLRPLDQMLIDAGLARAAGLVIVWDAPTDQLSGYWDPHSGTRYLVPSVFLGSDQIEELTARAAGGAEATIVVRAEWATVPTRNLIATLPGTTRERVVVTTNTDSVNWVQENGTIAAIALARYFGSLPADCRGRDIQFALTSNHLGYAGDGTFRYGQSLDADFDKGTVAFVMALEHLGAREILPVEGAPDGELELTGEPELFAWSAPTESPVLVQASLDVVRRRELVRTAVIQGVGLPDEDAVPSICSQGGLGTNFHGTLIPTIAGISGPWSLWAPSFGEEAVDFDRMRDQTMAFGDIAIQLDDVPRLEIAGGYVEARERRDAGAPTCDIPRPPLVAPSPD